MDFKILIKTFAACLLVCQAHASVSCPANFPNECKCSGATVSSLAITCPSQPILNWNPQKTFNQIAKVLDSTENLYLLNLMGHNLDQPIVLGANTITNLKFKNINIFSYGNLDSIHEDAFPSTYITTESFGYSDQNFTDKPEIIRLVNKFVNLQSLGVGVEHIPTNGLKLPKLEFLTLKAVQSIEDNAFAELPSLKFIALENKALFSSDGISDFAFDGINPRARVTLDVALTHLPESKFKRLFDSTQDFILVNYEKFPLPTPKAKLHCDHRVDWICKHPKKGRLLGYPCLENGLANIAKYCESK